jgi:hypothetical protein
MECNIDLRYAIPAVISLIFVVLSISEDNPWFQLVKFEIASLGYPIFVPGSHVHNITLTFSVSKW